MSVLGLDYGEKRIGVAVSDPMYIIALSVGYIDNTEDDGVIDKIKELICEHKVEKIIVGLPIRWDGKDSAQTEKTRVFIAELEDKLDVPVEAFDERFTTKTAQQALISGGMSRKKRKQKVDKIAAQIMLQNYMNKKDSS